MMTCVSETYGKPIGEVLGDGFQVPELLEGWTALEGIVVVKCLDDKGRPSWAMRETEGISEEETIGALTVHLDMLRERALDSYRVDDDE